MTDIQLRFDRLYQTFFNELLRRRPVNASFIGKHEYDHLLPDYSPEGVAETVAGMQDQLTQIRSFSDRDLTRRQRMDKKQIEGYLEIQLWEFSPDCRHFYRGNPSMYVGEAIFGLLVCLLTDYAPLAQRLDALQARMQAIPAFFAQAERNLLDIQAAWARKAMNECDSAIAFLQKGLPRVTDHFEDAAQKAERAFAAFRDYLGGKLAGLTDERVGAGRDAFEMMMERAHFVKTDLAWYAQYAQSEVERASQYLKAHCTDFGADTPAGALAQLADFHPTAEGYLARFEQLWNALYDLAKKNDLVTWPDFPIVYRSQHDWAIECAPGLYFLNYRSPAAFNRPVIHEYLTPTPMPGLSGDKLEDFLRANNDSVIKSNHVVHHGGLGHHVQNWNAYHQTNSLVGQFAACDGANRLTMMSAGTMAEGWAVYATHLADEFGFLTPLEHYAEMQSHRRMAARAVVDIKLHLGEWPLARAAAYYREEAGMPEGFARSEAVKNSMYPGGAIIYLLGCDTIFAAREAVKKAQGGEFSLGRFHDSFLSFGSVPAELARRAVVDGES